MTCGGGEGEGGGRDLCLACFSALFGSVGEGGSTACTRASVMNLLFWTGWKVSDLCGVNIK